MARIAENVRKTSETDIAARLNLDGVGKANISTGIGFFDHMLDAFARHGCFDLSLDAKGDLEVDTHHTVEDCGIVIGTLIKDAVGDKEGIGRYGSCILPMDEVLVLCAVDLCGRPYFSYNAEFGIENIGEFETDTIREFFYAVSYSVGMNLHIKVLDGGNAHHMAEAMFKAFARALRDAVAFDPRVKGIPSTKGTI